MCRNRVAATFLLVLAASSGCRYMPWRRGEPAVLDATMEDRRPLEPASNQASTQPDAQATTQPVLDEATSHPSAGDTSTPAGDAEVVAGSLLQVNNTFITVKDVLRRTHERLNAIDYRISEDSFRRMAGQIITEEARKQIRDALLLAEANLRMTQEQTAQVDNEVQRALRAMIADAGGSRRNLEAKMARRSTTLDEFLEDYRKELLIRLYLRSKLLGQVRITRSMLLAEYHRNSSRYSLPKKVQMQLICCLAESFLHQVASQPADRQRLLAKNLAEARIVEALAALAAGDDFGDVARRLSSGPRANSGGVWPLMAAGSFRHEKVEQAAFELPESGVSGIIETEEGYFIVKAKQVIPARSISFEQAQEGIDRELRERKLEELSRRYMERLYEQATIVESEQFVAWAVEAAVRKYRPSAP